MNPFRNAKDKIGKMKFPKSIALRIVYNRLDSSTRRALKTYQKYLGDKLLGTVKKKLTGFEPPDFATSSNYTRAGATVVMTGGDDYFKLYPADSDKTMEHHSPDAYLYLANRMK